MFFWFFLFFFFLFFFFLGLCGREVFFCLFWCEACLAQEQLYPALLSWANQAAKIYNGKNRHLLFALMNTKYLETARWVDTLVPDAEQNRCFDRRADKPGRKAGRETETVTAWPRLATAALRLYLGPLIPERRRPGANNTSLLASITSITMPHNADP